MGIENADGLLVEAAGPCTSLPLMGIENLTSYNGNKSFYIRLSLPLMGIENQQDGLGSELRQHELITPHGDRKLDAPRPRCPAAQAAHYPSWGSKTVDLGYNIRGDAQFSLPLMGIENSWQPDYLASHARDCSLPLMGIENT